MTALSMTHDSLDGSPPAIAVRPVRFPGRWVGGGVGVLASLLVAGILLVVSAVARVELIAPIGVCVLGVPIAFVLGRHFEPVAHDGGWRSAAWTATQFALLAPILGDLEIALGSVMAPWLSGGTPDALVLAPIIALFGLFYCWIALPVTFVVAVVWIVLLRGIDPVTVTSFEMPRRVARLGVRHAVLLLGAWIALAWGLWMLFGHPVRSW